MKARVWSWLGGPVEEFGPEERDFSPEEIVSLCDKYDVLIQNVKIPREKGSFRSRKERRIPLFDDVKVIFLDEKGKGCRCR